MKNRPSLSVIVPLAPEERAWKDHLIHDLRNLPKGTEVIFVAPDGENLPKDEMQVEGKKVEFVHSNQGRAAQMNAGAKEATGEHLWFVHADSKFTKDTLSALTQAMDKTPDALLHFKLKFHNGPKRLKLNALGANLRSTLLKMPFGDQGLCIKKELFNQVGGYRENVAFGEDYHFVEDVKERGIAIKGTGAALETGGEKYAEGNWRERTRKVSEMLRQLKKERKHLSPLPPIMNDKPPSTPSSDNQEPEQATSPSHQPTQQAHPSPPAPNIESVVLNGGVPTQELDGPNESPSSQRQ